MKDNVHPDIIPLEQFVIDTIKDLRRTHNLSTKDLGKIIQTGPSFISNIESGKCAAKYNLKHISRIANHLKISPKDFMPE